jgi:hypothetical protein
MQVDLLVRSHGSVGLDETLDWFIEFQFSGLENADATARPLMKLLSEKPTIHVVGTLSQPQWKPEGLASQVLQTGIDLLRQRMDQRRQPLQQATPANPHDQTNPSPQQPKQ